MHGRGHKMLEELGGTMSRLWQEAFMTDPRLAEDLRACVRSKTPSFNNEK